MGDASEEASEEEEEEDAPLDVVEMRTDACSPSRLTTALSSPSSSSAPEEELQSNTGWYGTLGSTPATSPSGNSTMSSLLEEEATMRGRA